MFHPKIALDPRNRRTRRPKLVMMAAALAATLLPAAAFAAPASGAPAPQIDAQALSGAPVDLADLRGKPVYLSFFTSWCVYCNAEAPALEALSKTAADEGIQVIGIDEQESPAAAEAFAQKYGITYPIALDLTGAVGDAYGIDAYPTNVFIDAEGRVSYVQVGEMTPAQISGQLARMA